jgi:hypothetical protein
MTDDCPSRRRGETETEFQVRFTQYQQYKQDHLPGGYMSTRKADGSSRGGAAEMFERYGFF